MRKYAFSFIVVLLLSIIIGTTVAQDGTIADVVVAATEASPSEFNILLAAVQAADPSVLEALSDPSANLTVFAPTDAAFTALMDSLGIDPQAVMADTEALTALLLYHVVEGRYTADQILGFGLVGKEMTTLQGSPITVDSEAGAVILNGTVKIVTPGVAASNGIIHVIDAVLLPVDIGAVAGAGGGEPCAVRVNSDNTANVRVGPGENRSSVAFLKAGRDFVVEGKATADDGTLWYRVNKEEAAPGKAINEAWVAEAQINTSGACDAVADVNAPPIIAIQPPVQPAAATGGGTTAPVVPVAAGGNGIFINFADWQNKLPANLRAASPDKARIVVTVNQNLNQVQDCGTYMNSRGQTITIRRYRVEYTVIVADSTGAVVGQQIFAGSEPPGCPGSAAVNTTLNGDPPPFDAALPYLQGFLG